MLFSYAYIFLIHDTYISHNHIVHSSPVAEFDHPKTIDSQRYRKYGKLSHFQIEAVLHVFFSYQSTK